MKSICILAAGFFLVQGAQAGNICKSKKDLVSSCGYEQESQLLNYESIFKETIKSSEPEEILTLVDAKGIQTQKYQDFATEALSKSPITIQIDPAIIHQTMFGFGGSITDSCLENLKRLSPSDKEKFFKNFFDRKSGAGFGYLRVPIGSNDFSKGDYTLNDTSGNKQSS